jgi:hypothetical protein
MFSRHCNLSRNIRHVSLYHLVGTAGITDACCITFAVANVVKPFLHATHCPHGMYTCHSSRKLISPDAKLASLHCGEISLTMQLQSSIKTHLNIGSHNEVSFIVEIC